MPASVGTTVPEHAPAVAAKVQGRADLTRAAIGRIAYRVGKGMPINEAISREDREMSGRGGALIFRDIYNEVDVNDVDRATIIRYGLGRLMGLDHDQAQFWATTSVTIGRPRKNSEPNHT